MKTLKSFEFWLGLAVGVTIIYAGQATGLVRQTTPWGAAQQ